MKRTILSIFLALSVSVFVSMPADARDERQRTVLTIVQDALAQLPAQSSADLDAQMLDIAKSAPESVELLAGMLVPASEGENAKVEYAVNGLVSFVSKNGNGSYAGNVKAGLASALRKCTDVSNKAFLLTQLALVATADDIPVFVEFAGDERLGSLAVNALIGIGGSENAILDLIRSEGASRPLLAYAAAEKRIAEAEPYLLEWVRELDGNATEDSDPSSKVDTPDLRAYYHALACCGSAESAEILKENSVYEYVTLLGRLADTGDVKTALSGAGKLLKSDDTHIRCAALELVVGIKGLEAQKEVLAALKSPDKEYRNAALEYASGFSSDTGFLEAVAKLLRSSGMDTRTDIVSWIGVNGVVSMLPDVVAYIPEYAGAVKSEPSPELVAAAVSAAGRLGGDVAADALVEQLSGDEKYAGEAFKALLSFDGDLQDRLAAVLEEGGSAVPYALKIACARRMTALAPDVFALLKSGDSAVKEAAYDALWGVVTPDDCAQLGSLLESADSEDEMLAVQKALCFALRHLAPQEQYAKVSSLLEGSADPSRYFPALAQAGTLEAVACLKAAYDSGEYAPEAFDALMTVDSESVVDVLMAIAAADAGRSEDALTRVVGLVSASGLDDMSKVARYSSVLKAAQGVNLKNRVLDALAQTPVMPAFLLAAGYLDDPQTAYKAAAAVKAIASRTTDEIDYTVLKSSLEKAIDIFSATGGADDGYAVDEIRKMLAGIQPPAEKFVLPEDEARAGFEVLFDGTDLSEWTGDMEGYTPVNGTIFVTAGYGDARNLYTKKEYRDFIFRFDFCFVKPGVNNGVGIRTPMGKDAAYWGMCEVQILDHDDPIYKGLHEYQVHGSVYGVIPARRVVHKPLDEWNTEEIKVVGDRVTVTLNGEVILDGNVREACQGHNVAPDGSDYNPYTVDHRNHPGMFNEKGHVGFLGHGAGIKFRNVRILDLNK